MGTVGLSVGLAWGLGAGQVGSALVVQGWPSAPTDTLGSSEFCEQGKGMRQRWEVSH